VLAAVKRWVLAILAMLAFAARGSGWLRSRCFATLLTSAARVVVLKASGRRNVKKIDTPAARRTKELTSQEKTAATRNFIAIFKELNEFA
jgi:hypothetical protein